ncbi:MAG: geranylgeranylglycerol-phosphate geranylgeranyltransferase [Candidatus Freyarchaeum deiterrae]
MEFKACVEIIRPVNCVMGGLTVLSAVLVANVFDNLNLQFFWSKFWIFPNRFFEIAFISYFVYFLIAAAGMVINDIFDLEVDKINKPNRPLPRGALTVKQAVAYTVVLWASGVALAFWISVASGILALIFSGIGLLYAARVKVSGLLGNFVVAFSFAFGYIYGSFITSMERGILRFPLMTLLFFITAFMVLQGREIIKGMEDVEGDKCRNAKTIACVYGLKRAGIAGSVCNAIGIISFTACWILDMPSLWYSPILPGLLGSVLNFTGITTFAPWLTMNAFSPWYILNIFGIAGSSFNFTGMIIFTSFWVIDMPSPWYIPKLLGFWFIPFYFAGIISVAISITLILWKYESQRAQKWASLFVKLGALFGLIAFLVGPLIHG